MRIQLLFFFALLAYQIDAQDYVDLVKVEYDFGFKSRFTDTTGKGQFSELSVDAMLPLPISDKTTVLTGVFFEQTTAHLNPNNQVRLGGALVKIGVNSVFNNRWSSTLILLPKLSSQNLNWHQRGLQVGGVFLTKFSPRKNFNYRFGLYANSDLYGPMLVPIVGFYKLHRRWEISCALPINARISYGISERFRIGTRFDGQNKSYLTKTRTEYIEKVNNEVGFYIDYHYKSFHLQCLVGHSFLRQTKEYKTQDKVDLSLSIIKLNDMRRRFNTQLADGPVARVAIYYRFSTKKEDDSTD